MFVYDCEAILFDLDGTLVDSSVVIERNWRRWVARHELDWDEVEALMHGRPAIEIMRAVAPHLHVEDEFQRFAANEATDLDGVVEIPGALELLHEIPPHRWGVVTSGSYAIATGRINHIGLPMPAALVTSDEVEYGKPAPDPYLLGARKLGIRPQYCLVLEDAPVGIQAAKSADMKVIGIATSHARFQLSAAEVVVDDLSQVHVEDHDDYLRVRIMP